MFNGHDYNGSYGSHMAAVVFVFSSSKFIKRDNTARLQTKCELMNKFITSYRTINVDISSIKLQNYPFRNKSWQRFVRSSTFGTCLLYERNYILFASI